MYSEMADSSKIWPVLQNQQEESATSKSPKWPSKRYIFQKLIMEKEHQQLHVKYNSPMSNINDFELFRRHKNLEHVQHDQRVGRVSQTAKIERPRDPSIESSSSVGTRGTRSSATLTCDGTVWTVNLVLIKTNFSGIFNNQFT